MVLKKSKIALLIMLSGILGLKQVQAEELNNTETQKNGVTMEFTPDPKIQEIAEHYAAEAVSFSLSHFKIELDWSDESIKKVESILDHMHQEALKDKPSDDEIFSFAKAFGSYIGEVYRRNHGAEWGMLMRDGESYPGLQPKQIPVNFWPWAKVQNRIKEGEEDNVVWYYYMLLQSSLHNPPSEPPVIFGHTLTK